MKTKDKQTANQKVMQMLNRKGWTWAKDYPTGFRLGARAFDLREKGVKIKTVIDEKSGLAKYYLVK